MTRLLLVRVLLYSLVFSLGWISSHWYFNLDLDQLDNKLSPGSISLSKTPFDVPQASPKTNKEVQAFRNIVDTKNTSTYDRAASMLAQRQFADFLQIYMGLRPTASSAIMGRYQRLMFKTVKKLQKQNAREHALILLSLFLDYEYDNIDALLIFADIQLTQKNYLASMDALFRARSYAYENTDITVVNKKLRALISKQRARLNTQDDKLPLLDFFRRLTELEPEYAPNFVALAEVYISLGNPNDARIALGMVSHDPSVGDQVDRAYAKINQSPSLDLAGATPIPMIRINNQFLIDVIINNQQTARLLLDTGASISIISPEILSALGLQSRPAYKTGWFNTANGVVSAPIYNLQSLSVENNLVESIDVGVLSVSSSDDIDGLLGMNFLKQFKFYIDQQKNTLFLQ